MLQEKQHKDQTAMVALNGAPGDHLHALPALRQFSRQFKHTLLTAQWHGGLVKAVYENTDIFDKIIWLDAKQMEGWTEAQIGEYMLQETADYAVDWYFNLDQLALGKGLMFSPEHWDQTPVESIRGYNNEHTFYDHYCTALKVSEVKGQRPKLVFTEEEWGWLGEFRSRFNELRLVGWQWSGSAKVKEFPRSEKVIFSLLGRYPDIHILAMGSKRFYGREIKHPRFTNLAGQIKWRQAVIITSELDLYIAPDTSVMVAAQMFKDVPKILLATTTSGRQTAFPETQIIQSTAECSPCYRVLDSCNLDDCCGKIDDQKIYKAVADIL